VQVDKVAGAWVGRLIHDLLFLLVQGQISQVLTAASQHLRNLALHQDEQRIMDESAGLAPQFCWIGSSVLLDWLLSAEA
jgi:hypothetical protein